MKKTVVLMLSIFLCLSFCAYAEAYPSGWYSLKDSSGNSMMVYVPGTGAEIELPTEVSMIPYDGVPSFSILPGEYTVGIDFPAGIYSAKSNTDGTSDVSIFDKDGKYVYGAVVGQDIFIGKYEFKFGQTVRIKYSSAYFSAPSGIIFD